MGKKTNNTSEDHKPFYAPGRIRGLDTARYLTLTRMVKFGKATWKDLEQRGISLPPSKMSNFRKHVEEQLAKR